MIVTPPAIFHSFTCVSDISELAMGSPDLRPSTLLVDPFPIGPINDRRPHEFLVDSVARTYTAYSGKAPVQRKTTNMERGSS